MNKLLTNCERCGTILTIGTFVLIVGDGRRREE